ncbi:MAG: phenylacetate--CoA ligase family protein [Porticoccaceae bacterium]|nr:phenylacetate--CoA ligase family protein [Porticoccaceae bacterium]
MYSKTVRNLLFPLHEKIMKRPTFSFAADLEETQWLSRDALKQLQLDKLKALLNIAVVHSPWHAERIHNAQIPLSTGQTPTFADLVRLPTMDKSDAQSHRDKIAWPGVPGGGSLYNTGGSSGQPLIFYYGKERQASDAAGRIRARRWWGVDVGDKEVYLWGAPVELAKTDRVKQVRDRLMNQLLLNAFDMSVENMELYTQAIEKFQPRCIYGYASSLTLLAKHVENRGKPIQLPQLKVVCTTGEPLYPNQRAAIQQAFGAPVANEFGSRDIGFTAHESPEGQMLLLSENMILEILNSEGHTVAPGETGEAVITGLCSQAQPFIRYRTGDMVKASAEQCTAGRSLHVLGEVVGRSTDFIIAADGTIMHALAVIYVLRAIEGIGEFKIIQHSTTELEVQFVASPTQSDDAHWQQRAEQEITAQLKQRLGQSTQIILNKMDKIPPEKSGKHRYVVSHVALPDGYTG